MFTIEQINAAHAKVKSGADFPAYVQEIIQLGVSGYEIWVTDGHTVYFDKEGNRVIDDTTYAALPVAADGNIEALKQQLSIHQQGETDYAAFTQQAAEAGVEKWVVLIDKMSCTYYDKAGNEMLTEEIPH